ncbi:hypothetical protein GCM10012320_27080 [Sinomonas cellulolyticus]|uniref:histidine kinase n=1 Tax=Sinomonas cellulolyticus TaxID=2801916 RepID=A0ABS1K3D5_9MICC|nr:MULTISPECIES: sensor histidine kinase [Sinomonas]MBL0706169.1 sensor histidine kinase [Sinomonas cellulolyticus]GHG55317.1 hypothetical protein GCM10012320_27080 [Sinomonas sp. KCTC 49339]
MAVTVLGSAASGLRHGNFLAEVIACLIVVYTAGYALGLRPALAGFGVVLLPLVVLSAPDVRQYAWIVIVLGGTWGVARVLRSRHQLILNLRATTAELERSREELADRAVTQERLRIARDLHDVVAHSVTVMLVQAAAAERTMHRGGPDALEAVRAVQETARDALAELRRMLGVLRPEGGDPAPSGALAPQPGLAEVERLVMHFRDAGLEIEYAMSAPHKAPPPSVQLAAYRVIQEALTNVLKHSSAPRAFVSVRADDGALVAEVRDAGPARGPDGTGGGQGIVGMRERVAGHGGRLSAGTTPGGGFCVTARLPLGAGS